MNDSLDSRQLKAFAVLAKTGSVTKTAEQLCVTHSAISHSMRALEGQVSCRLFCRLGKRVMLTEAGEALLLHAERVLAEMSHAHVTLAQLNKWGSRRLRLGVEAIFPADFLAAVLLKFQREFPRSALQVEMCPAGQAVPLLEKRVVDLVLAAKAAPGDGFEFQHLLADRFHFVVNPGHPLAAKTQQITRGELVEHPCILLRGCGHERKVLEQILSQRGIALNIVGEVEHLDTVKSFVRHASLMSLLPGWVIAAELNNRWFVSLRAGKKPVEQSWGLLHSRTRPLNYGESALWKFCGEQVANLA